jgi:heme/copper-type cytochrome/quinol oxidase subunit 4
MFAGMTSLVVTALCALIGMVAFVSMGVLTLTGGSEYTEFALVMVLIVSFVVGSYWWIVSGPGRYL